MDTFILLGINNQEKKMYICFIVKFNLATKNIETTHKRLRIK